jgi:hypothetical protein
MAAIWVKTRAVLLCLGILALIVWAVWLRVYPSTHQPYWMDEGYTIVAVIAYAEHQVQGLSAVLESGAHYRCFLYCNTTAHLTSHFGSDSWVYRALAIVFGLLSVAVIYRVVMELYTRPVALMVGLLTLFSYFHIAWSAQARWYTLVLTLFWLCILCVLLARRNTRIFGRVLYLVLALLLAGIATLEHAIAVVLFPLIPFVWILAGEKFEMQRRHWVGLLAATGAVGVIVGIAVLYFEVLQRAVSVSFLLPYYLQFLVREYFIVLIPAIFALLHARRREWMIFGIFCAYLIPLSFLTEILHYRYLFYVLPALTILAAVGLYFWTESVDALRSSPWRRYIVYVCFCIIYIASPTGILVPQERMPLESDDPAVHTSLRSHAYTPQPDWNAAYAYIQSHMQPDDVVISTHPQFTKIFLNRADYWLSIDYLGKGNVNRYIIDDNREYYVGAQPLTSLEALRSITDTHSGYIVFDYMGIDGRIDESMLTYILDSFPLVFKKTDASFSQVWVYAFE